MVLTDREIQAAIQCGQLVIDPSPRVDAYSSTSLDLTLSKFLRIWKKGTVAGVEQVICPATEGYKFNDLVKAFSDSNEIGPDGYIVQPQ